MRILSLVSRLPLFLYRCNSCRRGRRPNKEPRFHYRHLYPINIAFPLAIDQIISSLKQCFGAKNSIRSSPIQSSNQALTKLHLSRHDLWIGTKSSILFPAIKSTFKFPLDKPSEPWAIIRFPATWHTFMCAPKCISKYLIRRINLKSSGNFEFHSFTQVIIFQLS